MESLEPLAEHGDDFEKAHWPTFVQDEFPEYAEFWRHFVQPLREHPEEIKLKRGSASETGLEANGVIVSELHYSTFMHLAHVYEIKRSPEAFVFGRDSVAEVVRLVGTFSDAIVRLSAATDTADELLERVLLRSRYEPWNERKSSEARSYRRGQHDPLPILHNYRNRLVHGPLVPHQVTTIIDKVEKAKWFELSFPKFEKLSETLDSRTFQHGEVSGGDYALARNLVGEAWTMVLTYLWKEWASNLLPLLD
jgi:hypothetical protein